MTQEQYQNYIKILRSELIPAMGCTEPIAVAFAAAKAREVLGCMPEAMVARCSGNIIKNVKSVIVPNSGNERGVEAAAVLGAVAGQADLGLQVISQVTPEPDCSNQGTADPKDLPLRAGRRRGKPLYSYHHDSRRRECSCGSAHQA